MVRRLREKGRHSMMLKKEETVWDFVLHHRLKFLVILSTLLSLYARFAFRGFITGDMEWWLLPWYDTIKEGGGFSALSAQTGNYQIVYQTLIAVMTYLPIHPVYAYKLLSILFDYGLGIAAAACVYRMSGDRFRSCVAYALTVNIPTVVLNSAAWGQCDSIYTFFLVMTFYCLLREKYTGAFLLYGLALAFKLQAVLLLPFLLFYYVWSRKFSAWKFLLSLISMAFSGIGGIVQGRSVGDLFSIYFEQAETYQEISLNYPSFWNLLAKGEEHYTELHVLCLVTTVIILGLLFVWLIQRAVPGHEQQLLIACLTMYTCVIFLPAMHERYSYPVLIFALIACFVSKRMIPMAVGLQLIDLRTYGEFFFKHETVQWDILALMNLICYAGVFCLTVRQMNDGGKMGWKKECPELRQG